MKRILIPTLVIAGMLFASTAEAGLLRRVASKAKAAAAKVVGVVKGVGSCAGGRCAK